MVDIVFCIVVVVVFHFSFKQIFLYTYAYFSYYLLLPNLRGNCHFVNGFISCIVQAAGQRTARLTARAAPCLQLMQFINHVLQVISYHQLT